jgi:hypothetical protein
VHFIHELAASTRGVYEERGQRGEEEANRQAREQAVFGTPRVRLLLLQRLVHDVLLEGDGLATEAHTHSTSIKLLWHVCNTFVTLLQHFCDTSITFLPHVCNTSVTLL